MSTAEELERQMEFVNSQRAQLLTDPAARPIDWEKRYAELGVQLTDLARRWQEAREHESGWTRLFPGQPDVTDADIRGLRDEALAVGDFDQAALCEAALSHADDHPGKAGRAYAEARRKCAEVILRVRWQATDEAWRAAEDTSCDCGGGHA